MLSCLSSVSSSYQGLGLGHIVCPAFGIHCGMNEWPAGSERVNEWVFSPASAAGSAPWVRAFLYMGFKGGPCKVCHKTLAWFGVHLPARDCLPSFRFLPELARWRFSFLCDFPFFLSWPLFPSARGSLPAVNCQQWLMLGEPLPLKFLCWCLVSRFKFHLILREGPGCGLEPPSPEKGPEAWFALDKPWDLRFFLKQPGPPTRLPLSLLGDLVKLL